MQQQGRMEKLKESVGSPQQDQAEALDEPDLNNIIERLRRSMGEAQPASPDLASKARSSNLKSRLEGKGEKLDFRKVSFGGSSKAAAPSTDSFFVFVGKVYSSFEKPVSFLAQVLSNLPGAANLRNDLEASDLNMTVEAYLVTSTIVALLAAIAALVVFPAIILLSGQAALAPLAVAAPVFALLATGIAAMLYPSMMAQEKAVRINRELPFALRHLSTQIKAGVSFHRALSSVAAADYGILSKELTKAIKELERGSSTEEALLNLAKRSRSIGLKKAIIQIIRSLKTGGNLSEIIKDIANDVSFESRMRVRDFVEKLNIVNVVFTMIAVVGPVVITIMSAVSQLPTLGAKIPFSMVVVMFAADAMAMVMIIWFIKKMEESL